MNTYLPRLFSVCLCLGVLLLISSVLPIKNIAEAAPNYTELVKEETYQDIMKQARAFTNPNPQHYGITISQTCYNIHRYAPINSTTPCPTYEAIMLLYPDTSDQRYSGEFIYKHNQLQRDTPKQGHLDYYKFKGKSVLFIDPPASTQSEIKMIRIESSMDFFKPKGGFANKVINATIYQSDTRYIDSCRNAVIAAADWVNLVGDTLNYMRNGCDDDFTEYNFLRVIKQNVTKMDIATSNKWLHDTFIQWVKDNCLLEYDKC